jgi:argininosuccinate lyase
MNKGKPKSFFFIPIPGYTHLQRAQPILAAHYLLAYVEMLERDSARFSEAAHRANFCPLGSGALAGTSLPMDRNLTARLLQFRAPTRNSLDAVSDRDFVAEFIFSAALTGVHLSRLAEDLILWTTAEFRLVTIGDRFTTGSSLMPQKKNPDVAELGRGKSAQLIGNLVSILALLKGLPMTYNRDLQDDKRLLFSSHDILDSTLGVFAAMLEDTQFNTDACFESVSDSNLFATEIVDYLVQRKIPFRQAHHLVGDAVRYSEEHSKSLDQLSLNEWQAICPTIDLKIKEAFQLDSFFSKRDRLLGAPSLRQVKTQLQKWSQILRRSLPKL